MKNLIQYWSVHYKRDNGSNANMQFKTYQDSITNDKKYFIKDCFNNEEIEVTKEEGNEIYKRVIKDYKSGKVKILKIK